MVDAFGNSDLSNSLGGGGQWTTPKKFLEEATADQIKKEFPDMAALLQPGIPWMERMDKINKMTGGISEGLVRSLIESGDFRSQGGQVIDIIEPRLEQKNKFPLLGKIFGR